MRRSSNSLLLLVSLLREYIVCLHSPPIIAKPTRLIHTTIELPPFNIPIHQPPTSTILYTSHFTSSPRVTRRWSRTPTALPRFQRCAFTFTPRPTRCAQQARAPSLKRARACASARHPPSSRRSSLRWEVRKATEYAGTPPHETAWIAKRLR